LIYLSRTLLMVCTMGFCNGVFPVYLPFLKRQGMSGAQTAALILMGAGMTPATVGIPLWARDFAGGAEYPWVFEMAAGVLCGRRHGMTMVPGLIFDHTGSYRLAYALMVLLLAAATGLLCGAYEIQKK
jgi:hypothetical protein